MRLVFLNIQTMLHQPQDNTEEEDERKRRGGLIADSTV